MLAAVRQNELALQSASARLKANRQIVLAAIDQNGLALEYASEALRVDIEIVMLAVRQNGLALLSASENLKANRHIVFEAIRQNGLALEYASDALKADREIVLAAARQNGLALEYASDALKADREIVLAADSSMEFASNTSTAFPESSVQTIDQRFPSSPSGRRHTTHLRMPTRWAGPGVGWATQQVWTRLLPLQHPHIPSPNPPFCPYTRSSNFLHSTPLHLQKNAYFVSLFSVIHIRNLKISGCFEFNTASCAAGRGKPSRVATGIRWIGRRAAVRLSVCLRGCSAW